MTVKRPTLDQLRLAADWLQNYESDPDDPDDTNQADCAVVAVWLLAEVDRRETDAAVTQLVRKTGATRTRARQALLAARTRPVV